MTCVSDPCIWTFYLNKFIRYPYLEVETRKEDTLYQINQKSCSKRRETTTCPNFCNYFSFPVLSVKSQANKIKSRQGLIEKKWDSVRREGS